MGLGQAETDSIEVGQLALLTNIEKLTQPYTVKVEQEHNNKLKTIKITHPGLITQLENAIQSSQTTIKRGGTLASQRNVIDASAWMLRDAIFQELYRMWSEIQHQPLDRNLTTALTKWHTQYRKLITDGKIHPDQLWQTIRRTKAWVTQIELKFDPPITLEVTPPCPKCGVQHVYNEHNDRVAAVIIVWQKTFANSQALCRGCGQTWVGESELRQLRYEIDQRDTPMWDER